MSLGYYAPMPPAPTGVAQYAESLLRHLKPGLQGNLYQLGNNGLHWEIYQRALREPGVVFESVGELAERQFAVLEEPQYEARVDGAGACGHDETFERCEAHCCVHRTATSHSTQRGAGTEMAGNDAQVVERLPDEFSGTASRPSVGEPVKAVAA